MEAEVFDYESVVEQIVESFRSAVECCDDDGLAEAYAKWVGGKLVRVGPDEADNPEYRVEDGR